MRVTQQSSTNKPEALEFLIELEFRNVGFWGGSKTGERGEKPLEQGRESTKDTTHLCCSLCDSNLSHTGGRRHYSFPERKDLVSQTRGRMSN